jgi:hypothetical protein
VPAHTPHDERSAEVPGDAADHVLSNAEYHAVVDAVRQWRAFGMEMVEVFEQQGGRRDPAYQGALRMVVLADQVLRILAKGG